MPNAQPELHHMETAKLSREGTLPLPIKTRPATTLNDVIGCSGYSGKAHSVASMKKAIATEISLRHAHSESKITA